MPRYLLRRWRVLRNLSALKSGRLLEIGCGAGALLVDMTKLGFKCSAIEQSTAAREQAMAITESFNCEIANSADPGWMGTMDYVLSMDVLEHIEDDESALLEWKKYLTENGALILGVPCHMSKFGPLDEWAGHYRRYEREELVALLEKTGFEVVHFETYGFPLANLTGWIRNRRLKNTIEEDLSFAERTSKSGIDRSDEGGLFRYLNSWLGRILFRMACHFQDMFLKTNLGDGFIVLARLKSK